LDREGRKRIQRYLNSGAMRKHLRNPTKKDVADLLKAGYVIDGTDDYGITDKKERVQHAVLLVPVRDPSSCDMIVWRYNPGMPVGMLPLNRAVKWMRYDEAITAIKYGGRGSNSPAHQQQRTYLDNNTGWQEERNNRDNNENGIFDLAIDLKMIMTGK
jgi:hypothetical protein